MKTTPLQLEQAAGTHCGGHCWKPHTAFLGVQAVVLAQVAASATLES